MKHWQFIILVALAIFVYVLLEGPKWAVLSAAMAYFLFLGYIIGAAHMVGKMAWTEYYQPREWREGK